MEWRCDHTFSPVITKAGRTHRHAPLQERSQQVLRERERKLRRSKAALAQDEKQAMPFMPKINAWGKENVVADAHERLYRQAAARKAEQEREAAIQARILAEEQESNRVRATALPPSSALTTAQRVASFHKRFSLYGRMTQTGLAHCLTEMGLFQSFPAKEASLLSDKIWDAMCSSQGDGNGINQATFVAVVTAILGKKAVQKVEEVSPAAICLSPCEVEARTPSPLGSPIIYSGLPLQEETEDEPRVDVRCRSGSSDPTKGVGSSGEDTASPSPASPPSEVLPLQESEPQRVAGSVCPEARSVPPQPTPARTPVRRRVVESHVEREVKKCTFHPSVNSIPQSVYEGVCVQAPGVDRAIERMEQGRAVQRKRFDENLRSNDTNTNTNGPTSVKPFRFETSRRGRVKPLLYVDVNLSCGRVGRIGIHEGDKLETLAANFTRTYGLDSKMRSRLEGVLEEQLRREMQRAKKVDTPIARKAPRSPRSPANTPRRRTALAQQGVHQQMKEMKQMKAQAPTEATLMQDIQEVHAMLQFTASPPKTPQRREVPDVPVWAPQGLLSQDPLQAVPAQHPEVPGRMEAPSVQKQVREALPSAVEVCAWHRPQAVHGRVERRKE